MGGVVGVVHNRELRHDVDQQMITLSSVLVNTQK